MNRSSTIYYKFKSEKKKYSINFDTTEISIADIKKEIIKRRNMEKVPEKFELLFYDENNNEIRDENFKVEPLKLLIIKRIPWYKLSNTFMEKIRDPSEISSLRFSDFVVTAKKTNTTTMKNIIDPLEKIQMKLNKDIIHSHLACKICSKMEDDPVIMICCGETVCENCAKKKTLNENLCPSCGEISKGFMPNKKVKELKDRLLGILNKQSTILEANEMEVEMKYANEIDNTKVLSINQAEQNKTKLPTLIPIQTVLNPIITSPSVLPETSSVYPHSGFFETTRFFIIKSSNKENVDLSQKYSEWATTVQNQKKLNEAFQSNNVILIFSVNKSGNFQGYAIMTSFISDKVSNIWQNESSVKLGGSFSVQWLSICEMPFSKVKNLVNPINNNEYVIKSRDTQELPKDIGTVLCNGCFDQEKFECGYKGTKPVFTDTESINKIVEEIKKNREKYFQRQSTVTRPTIPTHGPLPTNIPPNYPMPYMGHYMYPPNVDMSYYSRMPYMYPNMPYMPNMPNMPTMPTIPFPNPSAGDQAPRERSREKSMEKSVSSKKSGTSKKSNK